MKAKIAADMSALKAKAVNVNHNIDMKAAEAHANEMDWEAGFAIDYAVASVRQAKLAVLDALDSRVQAEPAKRAHSRRPLSKALRLARITGTFPNPISLRGDGVETIPVH